MMGPMPARFKPAGAAPQPCRARGRAPRGRPPATPRRHVVACRGEALPAAGHSTALTMSSTTFFASPKTIIVLSM